MTEDVVTPMLYSLADALEIDIVRDGPTRLKGSRKAVMKVFKGYSPTVVSSVFDSIVDTSTATGMIGVCVQVWGNLNVMCLNDNRAQKLSLFVYDRTKVAQNSDPFGAFWSRKHTYAFLGPCIKGVYWRSVYETKWVKLEQGPTLLRLYNDMRKKGKDSNTAYTAMWGDL